MLPGVGGEEDYSAEVARLEEELSAERESRPRTLRTSTTTAAG
ncbi:MAG TPA: hypothetical protein VF297_16155 [Pyrinomonadaceae bacterium]